jgi:hypothetical protein
MTAANVPTMTGDDGPKSPDSVVIGFCDEEESSISKTKVGGMIDGYTLHDDDEFNPDRPTDKSSRLSLFLSRLIVKYSEQLELRPIRTKSLTAGTLAVIGDLIAQGIEWCLDDDGAGGLDGRRVFAMFIEGSCFSGPIMHYAYEVYEHLFPIVRNDCVEPIVHCDAEIYDKYDNVVPLHNLKTEWKNVLVHVAFDQIFMAIFYVAGLMIITCVIEGHSDELLAELQNDYFRNLGASWLAAILLIAPLQILAFGKLDVSLRVLATNLIDILWVTIMSIVTHVNRDQSESFVKSVLIPMLTTIGDNIVDST